MAKGKSRGLIAICVGLFALTSVPLLSSAHPNVVSTSVNITNNSSREIRNVYFSHVNSDDWSGNQLGASVISPGQSFNLSLSCDQTQVRVIAEDADGCFIYAVINCGDNGSWTITNDTPRDCGS